MSRDDAPAGGSAGPGGASVSAAELWGVLEEAKRQGFLGPGPVARHLEHGQEFAQAVRWALRHGQCDEQRTDVALEGGESVGALPDAASARVADLGSGGGVPGLVLAAEMPSLSLVLVEANKRRVSHLARAVVRCDLSTRVRVAEERAESFGASGGRGGFDVVVARSFGPPAVVAECAAPLLRVGGVLVVSEPPVDEVGSHDRWPALGLALVGMEPIGVYRHAYGYEVVRQATQCPPRFPRRVGVPAKRPLF